MAGDTPWIDIKYRLAKKGVTLAGLARDAGVTPGALHAVATVPIPRCQEIIAIAIGTDAATLWPTRYQPDGKPVRRRDWLAERAARLSEEAA